MFNRVGACESSCYFIDVIVQRIPSSCCTCIKQILICKCRSRSSFRKWRRGRGRGKSSLLVIFFDAAWYSRLNYGNCKLDHSHFRDCISSMRQLNFQFDGFFADGQPMRILSDILSSTTVRGTWNDRTMKYRTLVVSKARLLMHFPYVFSEAEPNQVVSVNFFLILKERKLYTAMSDAVLFIVHFLRRTIIFAVA